MKISLVCLQILTKKDIWTEGTGSRNLAKVEYICSVLDGRWLEKPMYATWNFIIKDAVCSIPQEND